MRRVQIPGARRNKYRALFAVENYVIPINYIVYKS